MSMLFATLVAVNGMLLCAYRKRVWREYSDIETEISEIKAQYVDGGDYTSNPLYEMLSDALDEIGAILD